MENDVKDGRGGIGVESRRRGKEVELSWRMNDHRKLHGGALVGKLMTVKSFNVPTVIKMIRKGWNLEKREDLEIVETEERLLIFEFRRREDYLRILRGRPWSIQGMLLNVQLWQKFMAFREVDFNTCPFWIQFHDLPLEGMDVENAITLDSELGEVMIVENPRVGDLLIRSFLRVRVVVDTRKPLVSGMWTPRPGKEPIWIKARYERLQNFCYRCGMIGHDQRCCPGIKEPEYGDLEFGGWLGVQAARKVDTEMVCCNSSWEEWEKEVVGRNMKVSSVYGTIRSNLNNKELSSGIKIYPPNVACSADKERRNVKVKESVIQRQGLVKGGFSEEESSKEERLSSEGSKCDNSIYQLNNESPERKEDLSKALVVFGHLSPVSEVAMSFGRIKLKRELEDDLEQLEVKRRRLVFKAPGDELELNKQGTSKMAVRNSIRLLKRKARRRREVKCKAYEQAEASKQKVLVVEDSGLFNAEGESGWPLTATEKQ